MSTFRCISYWKGGFPASYLSIFSECVDTENVWKIMVSPGIFEFQGHHLEVLQKKKVVANWNQQKKITATTFWIFF